MIPFLGIDVAHYQGSVNWAKARASGVVFAFAKATEGTGYTDPQYPVEGRFARVG